MGNPIPKEKHEVTAMCPRCREDHTAMCAYEWSGRGLPRIYCRACRRLTTVTADLSTSTKTYHSVVGAHRHEVPPHLFEEKEQA